MLSGGQILEFPQPALTFPIGYDPKEPFKVGFLVGSDGVCYWPLFEPILFIVECCYQLYIFSILLFPAPLINHIKW